MVTAGIDSGIESTKIVILNDDTVVGKSMGLSGGAGRSAVIEELLTEALAKAGLEIKDVEKICATGAGKYDALGAGLRVTEPIAAARAARFFLHNAASVVDIGADQLRVVTLGEGEKIIEIALNQKCSEGIGMFIKLIARRLEMELAEVSALINETAEDAVINDGCVVFAGLGALELLNQGVPREKVAAAVLESMAVRANMVLNDKIAPDKERSVLIGGVAENKAFVEALKKRSGINFIVPDDAVFGGAIGAALIAAS